MNRLRASSPAFPGLLGCVCLAACSASPVTRYYALQSVARASASSLATAPPAANPVAVRLEPVVIPPELDRLELVSRSGPYRVRISDSERWAAPLDDQIRRVLSDDLATRLPPHWVADPSEPASDDPRRLLSITIVEFYTDDACATTLRVAWTLRGPSPLIERGTEQIRQPEAMPCADTVAAAMSSALGVLADRLSSVLLSQPQSAPAP